MHLSWLDPHKMRKMTVVGREKMVVFDDMELERKVTVYEKAPWEPATPTASGGPAQATSSAPRSRTTSRCGSSCSTSCSWSSTVPGSPRGDGRSRRRAGARPADDVAAHRRTGVSAEIHPTAIVYPGTVLGEGVKVLENAVIGKQPTLSPRSTAKREPLPPTRDRRRHDRLDGSDRLRGLDDRRAGDPRRPVVRARAGHDRRRRRRRPRLAGRERHDDRGDDEDPGECLHHRLLDARGARLHRSVRRHDERQLDGPHREAVRQRQGPDDPAWRADRRRRHPLPRDRDRRGGIRRCRSGRDEGRAAARRRRRSPGAGPARRARATSCSTRPPRTSRS